MTKFVSLIRVLLFVFFAGLFALPATAQVAGSEKPVAGSTPGGVDSGSSSDAELWRKIRQGSPGTVVGGDKAGGLMIQSGGQDWRLIRNGPLPKYAAWAILGMLLLLSLFFALRGRIKIDHGPSGLTMKRFSLIERVGHWLLASSFILLALTGLNLIFGRDLLIPLLGKGAFASITEFGKLVHNYVGFAFMAGLVMITVMWIVHNIPGWTDVKWLLRGGGMIGGGHPPAKKFNAGQKIIFWIVVLCGISISLSGWALMNPFTTNMFSGTFSLMNDWFGTSYATDLVPIQEQQYQSIWHTIMAVFMIVVVLAHIYIGSVGMEGALPAMTSGDVDTNWAREHHSLWVAEQEELGNVPSASKVSASVAAGAGVAAVGAGIAAASGKPARPGANGSAKTAERRPVNTVPPKVPKPPKFASTAKAKVAKPASKPKITAKAKSASSAKTATAKKKAATKAPVKAVRSKTVAKSSATTKPRTVSKAKTKAPAKAAAGSKAKPKQTTATKRAVAKSTGRRSAQPSAKPKARTATTTVARAPTRTTAKPRAATRTASKPRARAKPAARDDLKLIKGIGPQNERKLNRIGVRRFADVAKWTKKQQSEIGDRLAFPGRIEREEWVKQAKALAKGGRRN